MGKAGIDMRKSIKVSVLVGALGISTIVWLDALGANAINAGFGYDDYAAVLKDYIDNRGMVSYKRLKARRESLDLFVLTISKLDAKTYEKWSNKEKIAFWINAYNALTLKVIIDNYPIKPSFFKSIYYPKNSIRQIKGVWDKKKFKVMGKDMTLEDIEHKILRKKFDEPRIHFALVCAAMGCPQLRNEPYLGEKLEEQFENQIHHSLADDKKLKINRKDDEVHMSSIFKWFGGDFVSKYAPEEKMVGLSRNEAAVINFISKYLETSDSSYLMTGNFKIKYLKYDWSLNEQQTKDKTKHR